jgi:hypothetical protein
MFYEASGGAHADPAADPGKLLRATVGFASSSGPSK